MPVVAAVAAVASVGIAAYQINRSKKAAEAARRRGKIQDANETLRNRSARRRKAKELRVRQAQIQQASASSGTSRSSGETGALSTLGSSYGSAVADQRQNSLAVRGISRENQNIANEQYRIDAASAFGSIIQEGLSLFEDE